MRRQNVKIGDRVPCGGCGKTIQLTKGQVAAFKRAWRPARLAYCNHLCQRAHAARDWKELCEKARRR